MALFGNWFDNKPLGDALNKKAICTVKSILYEIEEEEKEKAKTKKEKKEMRFKIYERQKFVIDRHNNYVKNRPLGSIFFPPALRPLPVPKGYDKWKAKQK